MADPYDEMGRETAPAAQPNSIPLYDEMGQLTGLTPVPAPDPVPLYDEMGQMTGATPTVPSTTSSSVDPYDEMGQPTGVVADETPQQPAPPNSNPATANTGTTQAGKKGKGIFADIGKRPFNPLSAYSSYTYQISLYMITPDALDEFNNSGRTNIKIINDADNGQGGGAYLIAQSGGIANNERAPGFEYDYFIDNLVIDSAGAPAAGEGATVNASFEFTVTEAYGFSFLQNLKIAKDSLNNYAKTINYDESKIPQRSHFLLGIRFLGYDKAGNFIQQSPYVDDPDPTFERFYDITISNFSFRIDGKSVVYQIKAAATAPTIGFGQKRGIIDKGAHQLTGNTVVDILNQLMAKLNQDQKTAVDGNAREFANNYSVKFIGDASNIAKSSIVSSADLDKIKWPYSQPKDKGTVNDNLSVKSQPNSRERIVAFNGGTPILQAITSVITQSDYITNGLKATYTTNEQPNNKTDSPDEQVVDSNKRLKWFNITTKYNNAKFDTKIKDYVYDIEYQIRTYEIPSIMSPYADKTTPYYGPVKRYNYWWTGENSEIIKWEQTFNTAYFSPAVSSEGGSTAGTGGVFQVPISPGKRTDVDRLGKFNLGKEAQNTIQASLADTGAWAKTNLTILGDPDYLADPSRYGKEATKSFYQPDGFTIDPSAGQTFIEIKFLEAVDYVHDNGLMEINKNVLLVDYPVKVHEMLQGAVSFSIVKVKHFFRQGKFTQELELALNMFEQYGDLGPTVLKQRDEQLAAAKENAGENQRLQNRSAAAGLTPDQPVTTGTSGQVKQVDNTESAAQGTTPSGIANDDFLGVY